jgi:ferredoxin-NADP reductase
MADMQYYLYLAAGLVLVLLLAQCCWLMFDALRQTHYKALQHERALKVLDTQLDAALLRFRDEERKLMAWTGWRKFRVTKVEVENQVGDIRSFYLQPHDEKPIPTFKPGQFLTFQFWLPEQKKALVRCYSLSDCAREKTYRVSIKRVPGGKVSNFCHGRLREGDLVDVRPPAGNFFVEPTDKTPVVLIGGGIGITPVLSMLNGILESDADRETWFFYGVRHKDEEAFGEHLRLLGKSFPNLKLRICHSEPKAEHRLGLDYDVQGRVTVELFKQMLPSNNYDFYFCGPPPMMEALHRDLQLWGVPQDRIHLEAFGATSSNKTIRLTQPSKTASKLKVVFRKSNKTIPFSSEFNNLLDFAEAQGLNLPFSCRTGNCGQCEVGLVAGEVTYTQEPSYSPQAGSCLACSCVPKTAVELDA